jgi:dihydroneopterin aldolase
MVSMTSEPLATIEIRDMKLQARIGHYPDGTVAPRSHLLDMTLGISAAQGLVPQDGMDAVFDYDPLLAGIAEIAGAQHYVTQEFLLTRIAHLVAHTPGISTCRMYLRKSPGPYAAGSVGLEIRLSCADLAGIRAGRSGRDDVPGH